MLFLSRMLMKSRYFHSPTIVIITDRTDLDAILGDPDRLRAVATDFINHYEGRVREGATVAGKQCLYAQIEILLTISISCCLKCVRNGVREAEKMYSESAGETEGEIHIKEYDCICGDKYEKWLYEHEDGYRYILGRSGRNPLICFGINPSDAKLVMEDGFWYAKPDPTMCRVRNISEMLGFDGYIMLNLYPLINKNPSKLKHIDNEIAKRKTGTNLKYIKVVFEKYERSRTLWACWGTSIVNNECLINSLQHIDELAKLYGKKWKTIKWTKAEPVHPHHPLRISNDEVWEAKNSWEAVCSKTYYDVDMEKYINIF